MDVRVSNELVDCAVTVVYLSKNVWHPSTIQNAYRVAGLHSAKREANSALRGIEQLSAIEVCQRIEEKLRAGAVVQRFQCGTQLFVFIRIGR